MCGMTIPATPSSISLNDTGLATGLLSRHAEFSVLLVHGRAGWNRRPGAVARLTRNEAGEARPSSSSATQWAFSAVFYQALGLQ